MSKKHTATVIVNQQKVLLIQRSEKEDSEPNKWCFPNETMEDNETPEETVIRGVKEELNLNFQIHKFLFEHYFDDHITYVFIGDVEGELNPEVDEVNDYRWFSYKEPQLLKFAYSYNEVIDKLFKLKLIKE